MLNKIINSCHWRERRVEEREREKSQLWEPAVREEQEERRKVGSLRVLGKLWKFWKCASSSLQRSDPYIQEENIISELRLDGFSSSVKIRVDL